MSIGYLGTEYVSTAYKQKQINQNKHKGSKRWSHKCSPLDLIYLLFTKGSCSQREAVHKGKLFTKGSCSQREAVR